MSTADRRHRFAIVGLGRQGRGITALAERLGHKSVGAVDVGQLVGRLVAAVVPDNRSDTTIAGSVADMVATAQILPEIVVIAASVDLATTLDMAGPLLDRGINVVTLNPEGFAYDPSWADTIHTRAVRGGASLLNTGVQDLWYVHLPTLVAASAVDIRTLMLVETLSLEVLSAAVGKKIGIGLSAEDFAVHAAATADRPSVIGGPLVEAVRRMGATAGPMTRTVVPIIRDEPYAWMSGGIVLPPDRTQGFEERVTFATDRGFMVEGVIAVVPAGEDSGGHELRIEGVPDLTLRIGPLSKDVADIVLVSRIPDVVSAAPGVLSAAALPPPLPQFRRIRRIRRNISTAIRASPDPVVKCHP